MFNYEIISAKTSDNPEKFDLVVVVKDDPRYDDTVFEFKNVSMVFIEDRDVEASYDYEIRRQNSEISPSDDENSQLLLKQIFQDIFDSIENEYSVKVKEAE